VGLGTGSTVYYTLRKLGKLIKEGLTIEGVSTSSETTRIAKSFHIPLLNIDDVSVIDITIDGADEVDPDCNGIKGGGGALLYEKIIAHFSQKNIWVVDSSKIVDTLGKFPLPVEIVPFGYRQTIQILEEKKFNPQLRLSKDNQTPFVTDSDNYIVDLYLNRIEEPVKLAQKLNLIPGIIENGLFINTVDTVISGDGQTRIIEREL
jgi:ribose 5-phosphate isomerase A